MEVAASENNYKQLRTTTPSDSTYQVIRVLAVRISDSDMLSGQAWGKYGPLSFFNPAPAELEDMILIVSKS